MDSTIPPGLRINLGCGRKLEATPAEGLEWLNVDKIPLEQHGLRNLIIAGPYSYAPVDLFAYPWPWGDGTVDHFLAEHFLEHIPHEQRSSDDRPIPPQPSSIEALTSALWRGQLTAEQSALAAETIADYERLRGEWDARSWRLIGLDGFFAFFAEVWRCLKPGGTITAECPWLTSYDQFCDPTHTRAVMPKTLAFLCNTQTVLEDYRLPFAFTWDAKVDYGIDTEFRALSLEEALERAHRFWNVIHTWRFTLTKVPLPEAVHPYDRAGGASWIIVPPAAQQTEGVK